MCSRSELEQNKTRELQKSLGKSKQRKSTRNADDKVTKIMMYATIVLKVFSLLSKSFIRRCHYQNNSFICSKNDLSLSFSICKVCYKEKSGVGAIYGCEYPKGTFRTLFITSFQVLEIADVNEVTDLSLAFEDKNIGHLYITPDWVKWLFTSSVDKLNVTVIEFSLTALNVLSRMKYKRLASGVPVENEMVNFYQYCKENLKIGKGRINKVNGNSIQYSLDTEEYSIGFPILNKHLKVVGLHVSSQKQDIRGVFKAITIGSVLAAFKN